MHLPYSELERGLARLPAPPRDAGTVTLVVSRPESNARLTPARCNLTAEQGVDGDRWSHNPRPDPESQITLMRSDVAALIANGQPLSLPGDNLLVELDLSLANLPPGTRLRVGEALCEVTPKPHTGCAKFAARFGQDAREFANADPNLRLRGIHVRVVEPGAVGPGDQIVVLSRPVEGQAFEHLCRGFPPVVARSE